MALIRPIRRVKGTNITAAILNPYLRDNLNGLHWRGAYQTSDLVKNANTTLADLPGLSIPVVSGDVWLIGAHSFFVSNATADAKWAVTAPGGSTGRYGILGAGAGIVDLSTVTFGTGLACVVPGTLEDNEMIWGHITAGANGAIQLQAAQNTSTAVDTTFRQYSPLIGFRISTPGNSPIPSFSTSQVLDAAELQSLISDSMNAIRFQHGYLREEITANLDIVGQDLPGMSFRVRAGETWAWFSFIYFVSDATADVAFAATAPQKSLGRYGIGSSGSPITAGSSSTFGTKIKADVAATTQQHASFNGLVIADRDGDVQMLGAQGTSTAVNTTFYQDSHFVAFRL